MNKNESKKWVIVVGRMLLAYALVFAQGAWAAQNQATKDKAASPQKAVARQANEKQPAAATAPVAQTKQAQGEQSEIAVQEKRSRNGAHEGITVHGHWTIEVRNPDGSLARHIEFENSLDPGFTIPNPTAGQPPLVLPGGASFLSAMLTGKWSQPNVSAVASQNPPFWAIYLLGGVGLSSITTTTNSPCVFPSTPPEGVCAIQQETTPNSCTTNAPGFSCNLSVSALGTSPFFTGIQLSGSVAAQQNGQIATVGTAIQNVVCVGATPSNCLGNPGASASFTSSTNFPGAPISVIAGQTIAVTVNISFS